MYCSLAWGLKTWNILNHSLMFFAQFFYGQNARKEQRNQIITTLVLQLRGHFKKFFAFPMTHLTPVFSFKYHTRFKENSGLTSYRPDWAPRHHLLTPLEIAQLLSGLGTLNLALSFLAKQLAETQTNVITLEYRPWEQIYFINNFIYFVKKLDLQASIVYDVWSPLCTPYHHIWHHKDDLTCFHQKKDWVWL